ncbi:MAG: hypothetical protein AAF909_08135, partial [Pseudomonadota bacterium]
STGRWRKLAWLGLSHAQALAIAVTPRSAVIYAPPADETAFLVEAAALRPASAAPWGDGRFGALAATLAQLRSEDERRRTALRAANARTAPASVAAETGAERGARTGAQTEAETGAARKETIAVGR